MPEQKGVRSNGGQVELLRGDFLPAKIVRSERLESERVEMRNGAAGSEKHRARGVGKELGKFRPDQEAAEEPGVRGRRGSVKDGAGANAKESGGEAEFSAPAHAVTKSTTVRLAVIGASGEVDGSAQDTMASEEFEQFAGHVGAEVVDGAAVDRDVLGMGAGQDQEGRVATGRQFRSGEEADDFRFLTAHDVEAGGESGNQVSWTEPLGAVPLKLMGLQPGGIKRQRGGGVGKFHPTDSGGGHAGDDQGGSVRQVREFSGQFMKLAGHEIGKDRGALEFGVGTAFQSEFIKGFDARGLADFVQDLALGADETEAERSGSPIAAEKWLTRWHHEVEEE